MVPEDPNIEPKNTEQLTHSTKKIIFPLSGESQGLNAAPTAPTPLQPVIIAPTQSSPSPQNLTNSTPTPTPTFFMANDQPVQPAVYQQANTDPTQTVQPLFTVGGSRNQAPIQPLPEISTKKSHKKHRLVFAALSLLVVSGLAAGLYFGVYMNPSFIWSESLSNDNTAYTRLINYAYLAPVTKIKGASLTGNLNISANALNASVSIVGKSYNKDNTASIKIDDGVNNLDIEEKAITASGSTSPDYYVQLNGLKSLATAFGGSLAPEFDTLDGQWIEVDHNLIADIKQKTQQLGSGAKLTLTRQQILTTLSSIGKVNKKYLFNTDASTAVTKIVKKDGFQTLNNQKTYEYTIGFNKNNTKKYLNALCSAVEFSPFGGYIADNSHRSASQIFNCGSFANQADKLKASSTFNAWINLNNRLIQQIQVNGPTDPAGNYVALGYDYKGGDTFPFYFKGLTTGHNSSGSFTVNAFVNTKANTALINFVANFNKSNSSPTNLSGNFKLQANNTPLNLTAPANALPLEQVLNKLGLGPSFQQLLGASTPTSGPVPVVSSPKTVR